MIQIPNAVGLILCQQRIIEVGTGNVTLVNTFTRLKVSRFPTPPQDLLVYAMLTDGLGAMKLSLLLTRLDTMENILERRGDVTFTDPLRDQRMYIRLHAVRFPVPGKYQATLLADNEWVAQSSLELISAEN